MSKRVALEDAQKVAEKKRGRCLSSVYINNKAHLDWECEYGHKWKASYSNVAHGKWCPYCYGKYKTIHDMRNFARLKGGDCLSDEYNGNKKKLLWKCEYGHKWKANYANISQGKWCPTCRGGIKKDMLYARDLAAIHKGECISDCYTNSKSKMLWRCEKGHEWAAKCDNIQTGHWCPHCKCKTQEKLTQICEDIFGLRAQRNYKPTWLLNPKTNQKQEIDIFFKEIKVGIEYNGEQHYFPVRFNGMSLKKAVAQLAYIQKLDRMKRRKVKKNKDKIENFIIFSYKDKLTKEYVIIKLKECGAL